jgi:hypothetical protein
MLTFSRQWDPLPIHLNAEAARAKGHRTITASGQYTLCVKQLLLNQARLLVPLVLTKCASRIPSTPTTCFQRLSNVPKRELRAVNPIAGLLPYRCECMIMTTSLY